MRIERFDALFARALDDGPPAAIERLMKQRRQNLLRRLPGQVVEQNFSHDSGT